MRKLWMPMLAATMLLAGTAASQTDVQSLETALHGKPLGMRGYPADPVVGYTWINGKLVQAPAQLQGMEIFFTDTVRQNRGKIVIEGQSSVLVKNEGKLAPMGRTPMRLEIDLQGADATKVIPELQAQIFFPGLKAALEGLPEYVSDMVPFSSDGIFHSTCHCAHIQQDGKWLKLEENDAKLSPPGFVKMASNPQINQKAIDEKVSGTITLAYVISDSGRVDEVWVAKPLSSDIDELAARTGRENMFRPASYAGKPVGTVLLQTIPVN